MPQTLLAIGAVMMATFFSFQQQRSVLETRMQMIHNEVETAATAVAVDRLGEIGSMAYDDATKSDVRIYSSTALTSSSTFTSDAPPIDDIDDFHGASVNRYRVTTGDTLWYRVKSSVSYANEIAPDIAIQDPSIRTKFKKATVTVYSLNVAKIDTIRISQSFSCGSKCAW